MNINYKKLNYNYMKYLDKIDDKNFLNTYIFLLNSSNEQGKIITTPELISEYLERTVDKRTTKTEEYINTLNIMSNEIKDKNNNIIFHPILTYTTYLKQWNTEEKDEIINNRDILEIYLLNSNDDLNYIPVYDDEYKYLFEICKLSSLNQKRKFNANILVNLYFYLKYLYFINNQETNIYVSYNNISQKVKASQKTIMKYIKILQEYSLISIKTGSNSEENQSYINQYELLNKNWLITNQNTKIIELKEYLNNI